MRRIQQPRIQRLGTRLFPLSLLMALLVAPSSGTAQPPTHGPHRPAHGHPHGGHGHAGHDHGRHDDGNREQWVMLGQRQVNLRAERDTIAVTGREGRFTRIMLRVQGEAINLISLRVDFRNGGSYDVPVRSVIRAGGQTRAIDLPGDARVIRTVSFVYRTIADASPAPRGRRGRRGETRRGPSRATVQLFGAQRGGTPRPTANPPGPGGGTVRVQVGGGSNAAPPPARPARWTTLGSRAVNFRGDRDVIPVTARDGLFRQIALRVEGNAVHFEAVVVHYGNGTSHRVAMRSNIRSGGQTRDIDLPGDRRIIRSVELIYNTRWRRPAQGRATVTVLGGR